jgi:transaldolase
MCRATDTVRMHLYVDTADLDLIETYARSGVLDGVTTNPSIVAETEYTYREVVASIAERIDGSVFAQVIADDASGMVEQGRAYDTWAPDVVVKLPATTAGYEALDRLRDEGIRAGITVLFSVSQAILAAKNDATFVAPYVGRLTDAGEDGVAVTRDIQTAFDAYGFDTEVLAASVRNTQQARELYRAGVDALTLPPSVFEASFDHHKTDEGLAGFHDDWGDRGDPLRADASEDRR